ncbi:MAG: hypothetical protein R2818_00375 [Flavobacteriales bacterium]
MKILLAILALGLTTALSAQQYAMARVMESQTKKLSFIQMTYEDGKAESIPLEDWSLMGGANNISETMHRNQIIITRMLGTMKGKGYTMVSATASSTDSYLSSVFVFEKKE